MSKWTAYNDAHSRAVFLKFKEALEPLLANVAPHWLLHHIQMDRQFRVETMQEEVQIRLVIRPIGEARTVDNADLLTGHQRLGWKP
jgi:hypothetical protein